MSEAEQEKYAEIVRKLIEHENTLQNYRFTWFSASQALLLAALGGMLMVSRGRTRLTYWNRRLK